MEELFESQGLQLASSEQMIKEWDYATVDAGAGLTSYSLKVTNKRIVSDSVNGKNISRHEIPLDTVKSVSYNQVFTETRKRGLGIFLIIFGAILLMLGMALFAVELEEMIVGANIMLIVGVLMIAGGILYIIFSRKRFSSFTLEITTMGLEGLPFYINADQLGSKASAKAKTQVVTIAVNPVVVREIIDTLGSIIVENRPC